MPDIARWDAIAERYTADSPEIGPDPGPIGDALFALLDVRAGETALDLGCGPGHIARHLARAGARVTGVDASPALLSVALDHERRAPLGIRYVEADAALPTLLDGESFDAVVCSMALSDIDDLDGALRTVARLLRTGGRMVWSILHPCFPGAGSSLASSPADGYFAEGWWLAEGHHGYRGTVGAHHRTLATYLNAVLESGLRIDRVEERSFDRVKVPMFLLVRATA